MRRKIQVAMRMISIVVSIMMTDVIVVGTGIAGIVRGRVVGSGGDRHTELCHCCQMGGASGQRRCQRALGRKEITTVRVIVMAVIKCEIRIDMQI